MSGFVMTLLLLFVAGFVGYAVWAHYGSTSPKDSKFKRVMTALSIAGAALVAAIAAWFTTPVVPVALVALALIASTVSTSQAQQSGVASWYGGKYHGRRTASGETYDQRASTCAHRTHRFGTVLRVVNVRNGRSTTCRVNDRGPFVAGRIVDLSASGRSAIGMDGLARVRVEVAR